MSPRLRRLSVAALPCAALVLVVLLALRPLPVPAAAPGVTVEASGSCTAPAGVRGDWDVWHELVLVQQDTWFPPHVHDGVECILTVEGSSTWWFPGNEVHEVPAGKSFLVPDLMAHTAGNKHPGTMRYLSAHILRPGAPFRSEICASAAPVSGPAGSSSTVFNWVFRNQQGRDGSMTIAQRLERLDPGAGYSFSRPERLTYLTVLEGSVSLETEDGRHVLQPNEGAPIRRGLKATLSNTGTTPARLAVLEL
ncbi:MAG: cupin domain-containing protein [Geminicoccaceae bacterium]